MQESREIDVWKCCFTLLDAVTYNVHEIGRVLIGEAMVLVNSSGLGIVCKNG